MPAPLTASAFLSALRAEGVTVVERTGWASHNRNTRGAFGPVNGVMVHHTGPYSTEKSMVDLCWSGYSGLPGPLCHGVVDRSGRVHLVGYGRANHAGNGDDDVLDAVVAERALPVDDEANTDGNRHFYGFECINTGGGQAWPDEQVEAMVRIAAAICRAHGWKAASVLGHKEWQPGKPDPAGVDMNALRKRVETRLKGPANASAKPPVKDNSMPTASEIAVEVLKHDGVIVVPGASPTNPTWTLSSVQTEILKRIDGLTAMVVGQQAVIKRLDESLTTMSAAVDELVSRLDS